MANGELSPLDRRILQMLDERVSSSGEISPFEQRLQTLMARRAGLEGNREEQRTFGSGFARFGRGVVNMAEVLTSLPRAPFDPAARARAGGAAVGIISAGVLEPAQAVLQIPGLFTARELQTDRAADFLGRASQGLLTEAERFAKEAGLSDEEIADAHMFGEFVGWIAPIVASLKAARLITGVRGGLDAGIGRNLVLDSTAGAIFGGVLEPGENFEERTLHLLQESALFGVGSLVINGLAFPLIGMRRKRFGELSRQREVADLLRRLERGEAVELTEPESSILALLRSEEGYLTSSPEAQVLLSKFEMEEALIQGIRSLAETGESGGVIRSVATNFDDVVRLQERFQERLPSLKFDAVKREGEFDLFFGFEGLSNQQRAQFKREGRFLGQRVEKGGASYTYIDRAQREGWINVRTVDDKVTQIKDVDVTDFPHFAEELSIPTTGEALYKDYKNFVFGKWNEAAGASGMLTEDQIIRGLRDGTLRISDEARRAFDVGGAIIYPEELGLQITGAAEEFAMAFGREGKMIGDLMEPPPIRRLDDAFQSWLQARKLPVDAGDIEAFRVHFAQRLRDDLWKLVPDEDRRIFETVRKEFQTLMNETDLPLEVMAHSKGFNVDRLETGQVRLRDINTGSAILLASPRVARDALRQMFRTEGDVLGAFMSPGPSGIAGLTGGFDPTDGIFTFGDHVASRDFLENLPMGLLEGGPNVSNLRDWMIRFEEASEIPLFSKGFALLDEGLSRMRNRQEPWATEVQDIWKGLGRRQRMEVVDFWVSIEGMDISLAGARKLAAQAGLSPKQIRAFARARATFDEWARINGLEEGRYISNYYSRIRPWVDEGRELDLQRIFAEQGGIPPEFQFWADMQRTGELAVLEKDPEIVMQKYLRAMLFKQEVQPIYENVRAILGRRIKDLTPLQQQRVLSRALPNTTGESFVLPEVARKVLTEYLNYIRGNLSAGFETWKRFATKYFKMLGMEGDPRIIEELHSIGMSSMYGAAMALRPALTARNAVQTIWTTYTRVGSKHGNEALRIALTQGGFDEPVANGTIRLAEAGIPQADAFFNSWITDPALVQGTGPLSMALAGTIRWALRAGQISRKTAQKWLVPYSSTDQVNRAWSYWWQKLHTADHLSRFERGAISWDKFLEDGLPFFSRTIKENFRARYNKFGRETALQWIGKQGADEAQFIYGAGAQPAWMQKPFGRFLGMFGTWPLWAFELYARRMAHGTPKQVGAFWARTLALTGAFSNMSVQSGIALWNWIAPASIFGWAGGPMVDHAIQLKRVIDAPVDQKAGALRVLAGNVSRLALPGQIFYQDLSRALDADNPADAALLMMLGRPIDNDSNFAYDWIFNPEIPVRTQRILPASSQPSELPSIDELVGGRSLPAQGRPPVPPSP